MKVNNILNRIIEDNQPFFLLEYDANLFGCEAFSQRIYELCIFQAMPDGFAGLEMDSKTFRTFIKKNHIPKRHQDGNDIIWAYDDRLKDVWHLWKEESKPYQKAIYILDRKRAKIGVCRDEESIVQREQIMAELEKAREELERFNAAFMEKNNIKFYK